MRRFLTLVHKEWRDVRTLTWVSMALVVALAVAVRWWMDDSIRTYEEVGRHVARHTAAALVPFVVGIFGALIASDRVGGEVSSKRMDGLALLPVGPSRLWLAKTWMVLAATALFAVWSITVQTAVLAIGDGSEHAVLFLDDVQQNLWVAAPVAGSVLCVLFASSLGLSGIAALLVGGMLAGIVVGAATFVPALLYGGSDGPRNWRGFIDAGGTGSVPCLGLIVPSVLASWAIFAGGRVHLARWLRSGAIGAGVFAALLTAPTAVVAREITTLVPGKGAARVLVADASSDGRYVAMLIGNRAAAGVVIHDMTTGALREVPGAFLTFVAGWNEPNWQPDGTLRCELHSTTPSEAIRVDPATGRILERRARTAGETVREERERLAKWKADRWVVRSQTMIGPDKGKRCRASLGRGDGPATLELESLAYLCVTDDGRAALLCPERGRITMRTLPDGPERTVFEREDGFVAAARTFHDGRTLLARTYNRQWVVDVATGAALELPLAARDVILEPWELGMTRGTRRIVVLPRSGMHPGDTFVLHDMDTGATSALMQANGEHVTSASELPAGRLLLHRSGTSVVILGPDLRVERVLVGEE